MKPSSYLGAYVGWRVIKAFNVEAKRRGRVAMGRRRAFIYINSCMVS